MAKGRGSKSTKLQKAAASGSALASTSEPKSAGPSTTTAKPSKISDELRQVVKDLGGDEEDLKLIEGIDEDDEEPAAKSDKAPVDEKKLRRELGDFMKGLDFSGFKDSADVEVEEVDSASSEDAESDEEEEESAEEEEEEDEEEEDEEEDEDEEEEAAEEQQVAPTSRADKAEAATVEPEQTKASGAVDADRASGTNVPAAPSWPSLLPELPPLTSAPVPPMGHRLNEMRQRGLRLLETLPPLPRAGSSSDAAFINQILTSGTYQDKLSALVLLVRESPIHAVKELNRLRTMAGWKEDGIGGGGNKDQRVAVMKALADWWVSGGGKEKGKLRYFADQPLLAHPQVTDRHLLVFAFEDYMKKWFFNILQVLETLSHDTLPFVRTQSLHLIFQLLAGNAEQEQNLLRLGVNKLGDTDRPVASKASHHILQLLQAHPAMKAVVAREVSALVLKPAATAAAQASSSSHVRFDDDKGKKPAAAPKSETSGHARYYGLITLNQVTLTRKDQEVAGKMVDLYFEVFREILGNSMNEKDEGPAAAEDVEEVDQEKIEKVAGRVDKWRGRRKGTRTKNGKKSALEEEELVETGEAKLVAAILTGINRALPFAKLDETMFDTYMDTLFKITHAGTFNTSIQALNLIFQVSTTASESRQAVSDRFYRTLYDSLFDGRLITSSKQAMYLNLLFKAMKADDKISRVMAFVKRLLQMLGMHQPSFICGALYLLGELFSVTPGLKRMLIEPEDDGEEHFEDADNKKEKVESLAAKNALAAKEYDGRKREPLYANADTSCLWDLIPFLNHFHPSVSLQANQLLLSQPLTGSSDISLNTLVSFLDRFVYRNPKKTLQPKGASIMQPAAASDKSGMVVKNHGPQSGTQGVMVNSEQFWRKKIEDVPVEMMFFHRYFSEKLKRKEAVKGKGRKDNDDDDDLEMDASEDDGEAVAEDEDDDEAEGSEAEEEEGSEAGDDEDEDSDPEEAEIWKAMKASLPDAGDNMGLSEDEDESDDMSDYDDDDDDEEAEASEAESEVEAPKKGGKGKRAERSPSIASSQSSFPDFADEDEDIISESDMEMPDIVLDGAVDSENDEEEDAAKAGKRKRNDERKERRKKRKELPTFGSYEDYQKLIEEGPSEED
ncbi:hypothetical protein CI109_104842 [Kwoniella shandongensis]|uniref:Uncharacterized protein n=1 Tax=Kwoniella shandongensis TaxID=1734106 RepID=A0A5M6BTH1_9TREE|nr:uncharacterized protein CI109_006172 [Kwoniella shandongensis]KAA5525481.1 hypothetical protein CI109_006172 [Kwoniella shandongensis]